MDGALRLALLVCALLVAVVAPGCVAPDTELVVVIESDLTAPDEIDEVAFAVQGPSAGVQRMDSARLGPGQRELPLFLVLALEGNATAPVAITVEGRQGGVRVARQQARVAFTRGERREVSMLLLGRCARNFCNDDPAQTCGLAGACASADVNSTAWTGVTDPPVELALGNAHACARRRSGAVLCWGANVRGQLGDGTLTDRATPVPVAGLTDAVRIAAGGQHTCALRRDGGVVCWGFNDWGQLGDGTRVDRALPTPVRGLAGASTIDAGREYTCARLGDGTARCWGRNTVGQLGSGAASMDLSLTPVPVAGETHLVALAAGALFACAVRDNGTVACWGDNSDGQLGVLGGGSRATPTQVAGLTNVVEVGAGENHACARLGDRSVLCWGGNDRGQLGSATPSPPPTPTQALPTGTAASLAIGDLHSCVRQVNGAVVCWGANGSLQLGVMTMNDSRATPAPVNMTPGALLELRAGDYFNCAREAVSGRVLCWGSNTSGQLGDGDTQPTQRAMPGPVVGLP